MQLISVGNNIINLDSISVLDIDPIPNSNAFVVHVHAESNQPVIDITIPFPTLGALINMVPQHLRFPGND